MDLGKYCWRDGEFVENDSGKGKIALVDHALHYGTGVFEGIRFYETSDGPAVFRLREHMERLHYSASVLELVSPFSVDELCAATLELIRKNGFSSGYIRPVVLFGEGKMGINPVGADIVTFIAAWPWGKYLSDEPITVGVSPWIRIHPKSLQCDAKINGHYVNSVMSSQWAKKNNYQEALLLDYEGNIAEGPGENIFLVKDGKLLTPKLGTILAGITRATVIELAKKEFGIETVEKVLTLDDLFDADEAFFTGTAAEITIIKSVDGRQIGVQGNVVGDKLKGLYHDVVCGRVEGRRGWLSFCSN